MDEAGPQSLFVVLSYDNDSLCSTRILQLDTHGGNNPEIKPSKFRKFFSHSGIEIAQNKCVAQFGRHQGPATISWVFSSSNLGSCSTSSTEVVEEEEEEEELLYMVPYYHPQHQIIDVPLHGCVFNFRTKTCLPFNPPQANKFGAHVLNLDGYLCFIASPGWGRKTPNPSFECYDPAYDSWETLEPFPYDVPFQRPRNFGRIIATAVLSDTILFNICGYEIWAYFVPENKWYPVEVEDKQCYSIVGEAVVLADTIYALASLPFNLILALSIEIIQADGDGDGDGNLVFKCHLLSEILVRGMKQFSIREASMYTRHLCYMGKDNFCLVESCNVDDAFPADNQPIQLTNIKLKEETTMAVTGICGHLLPILDEQFHLEFCFSLPDRKATALKEGEISVFDLNPFPEGFDPNRKNKDLEAKEEIVTTSKPRTSLGDGVRSSRVNIEGCSICVRNISPNATFSQVEKELKNFGPVMGIEVIVNKTGEVFALVEFIGATPKQNALKASCIVIAGCPAVIEQLEGSRRL